MELSSSMFCNFLVVPRPSPAPLPPPPPLPSFPSPTAAVRLYKVSLLLLPGILSSCCHLQHLLFSSFLPSWCCVHLHATWIARPARPPTRYNRCSTLAALKRNSPMQHPFNQPSPYSPGCAPLRCTSPHSLPRRKSSRTPPTSARSGPAKPQIDLQEVLLLLFLLLIPRFVNAVFKYCKARS